jgi:hypothetical protein
VNLLERSLFVAIDRCLATRYEQCVICRDNTPSQDAIKVPCGHFYDRECAVDLFQAAMKDETLFPPKCCRQSIPLDSVMEHLPVDFWRRFVQREREYLTSDRLYCPNKACSNFLGSATPLELRGSVTCDLCLTVACSACKDIDHAWYEPCQTDATARQVLELAKEEGWQRCPGCRHIIQLDTGCYHMRCTCKSEFCYLCAETWKRCTCPQWEEARLIATAEHRVHNELEGNRAAPINPVVRAARVRQEVARLREDHNCRHTSWGYRGGNGNCESCGHYLSRFLLVSRLSEFGKI